MCARALGFQFENLLEIAIGFFRPLHAGKYHRKRRQRLRIIRTDLERTAYWLLRLSKTRVASKDQSEINECLRVLRIVFCRLTEKFFCFFVFSLLPKQHTEIILCLCITRCQSNRCC